MTKKLVVAVSVCIFFALHGFGQSAAKYKSAEIYDFSQKIEESSKDKIWTGFDFRQFTRLKTEAGTGFIYFSNEPDNAANQNFYWRLVDDYFLEHSLEENLVITFHEAFHAAGDGWIGQQSGTVEAGAGFAAAGRLAGEGPQAGERRGRAVGV